MQGGPEFTELNSASDLLQIDKLFHGILYILDRISNILLVRVDEEIQ